jgi:hypothetical protein
VVSEHHNGAASPRQSQFKSAAAITIENSPMSRKILESCNISLRAASLIAGK